MMPDLPLLLLLLVVVIVVPLLLLRRRRRIILRRSKKASSSNNNTSNYCKKTKNLPPSPPGRLPIIGHLHLIGDRPHASLRDLAWKHGGDDLLLLRLGAVTNVIVSSPRAAHAVLRKHDHVFASRPASTLCDALLYGSSDVGFAPYGEHWRQVRKLVTTHLFTVRKVQSYRDAREQEVQLVMGKIREAAVAGASMDVSELLNAFANDMVCRAVSGKFFRAEGRNRLFRELINANSRLFGGFSLLEDYFPAIARSPLASWFVRLKARQGHRRWDDLLETIINDHESSTRSYAAHPAADHEESDFIDVLLSVQQDYGITRDHIKAILMDMFSAGTDTSSLVLELAMIELMRHPHIVTKLQTEVRKVLNTPPDQLGKGVAEEHLGSMTYLKAVVKETLRLHPPAPLLLPHLAMADCHQVLDDGYTIPAGARVIVNAWAIGRHPESWENPEEFIPERFLSRDAMSVVDFRGNDFQFVPFGAGRRICPGLNFGLATVEIMLANLVYCFDWELPHGMEKEDIDMTEVFGLTVRPKEKLILVPKLPSSLG